MTKNINITNEYKTFITDIKSKITQSQIKIASTVNSALLIFYWELGEMISLKQKETKWGSKFVEQMANDLKKEFPSLKGFSRTNLFYIKKFYEFYSIDLVQRRGGLIESIIFQIPWRHNVEIFTKVDSITEALYYVEKTLSNSWGRDTLALNIKTDLFHRDGKSINNFRNTLAKPLSDLAVQTIKDPYIFDFLTFDKPFIERDVEDKLYQNN